MGSGSTQPTSTNGWSNSRASSSTIARHSSTLPLHSIGRPSQAQWQRAPKRTSRHPVQRSSNRAVRPATAPSQKSCRPTRRSATPFASFWARCSTRGPNGSRAPPHPAPRHRSWPRRACSQGGPERGDALALTAEQARALGEACRPVAARIDENYTVTRLALSGE